MSPNNHARAVRYRQLALVEPDKVKAAMLYQIADEAERDVLCSVDRTGMGFGRFEAKRSGRTDPSRRSIGSYRNDRSSRDRTAIRMRTLQYPVSNEALTNI